MTLGTVERVLRLLTPSSVSFKETASHLLAVYLRRIAKGVVLLKEDNGVRVSCKLCGQSEFLSMLSIVTKTDRTLLEAVKKHSGCEANLRDETLQ